MSTNEETMQQLSQPLTEQQVCELLKCSRVTLWRLRKDGKIQTCKTGRAPLFLPKHVQAYMEKRAAGEI